MLTGHVALVKTENRLGWSDNEETTLLLEGSVFIRIYIPSESSKGMKDMSGWHLITSGVFSFYLIPPVSDYHRECRLSLTSTVKNGVRILDIKPQVSHLRVICSCVRGLSINEDDGEE